MPLSSQRFVIFGKFLLMMPKLNGLIFVYCVENQLEGKALGCSNDLHLVPDLLTSEKAR